jgi:tetratricopeptide (TPR) repeat protein
MKAPGELREFTLKAVLLGVVMAALMGAANAYLGLKAGMTIAAASASSSARYFFQGQTEKARDMFQTVTKIVPDNINGFNNLGAAYFKLGDSRRAEAVFEKSNAIKRNPDACSNLGYLYYYRGRYADAAAMHEPAVGYEKNDHILWGKSGGCLPLRLGERSQGCRGLRQGDRAGRKRPRRGQGQLSNPVQSRRLSRQDRDFR